MGPLRLFFAFSVLFSHAGASTGLLFPPPDTAVYCFFIMSGFYISLGLNERYTSPNSNRAFYIGRLIRLWPTYIISLLILVPTGVFMQTLQFMLGLPEAMRVLAIFSNCTMFGIDLLGHISAVNGHVVFSEFGIDPKHNGVNYIFNMPAWSLSIELVFYALAPFVVRSFWRSLVFFAIGLTFFLYLKYFNTTLSGRFRVDLYFPYAMFYFGLGMLGYWLHRLYPISHLVNLKHYLFPSVAIIASMNSSLITSISYVALALVARPLFDATKNNKIDKFMGDLSYPIYILHIPIFAMVRWNDFVEVNTISYIVAAVIGSLIVLIFVERPIEKLRARMRMRNRDISNKPSITKMG